jgi:hypothetical protein
MAEIGAGSLIHSFHLPAGGHLLSLNQVVCLSLASRHCRYGSQAARVSISLGAIAGLMKVLSPAGKKMTPMLAIFVQSLLYAGGLQILGARRVGSAFGAMLLSMWGFIQPLMMAYVFFGETWFQAMSKVWNDFAHFLNIAPESGWTWVWTVVAMKALLAAALGWMAWGANAQFEECYFARMDHWFQVAIQKRPVTRRQWPVWLAAFFDLMNPLFILSLILCGIFLQDQALVFVVRTVIAGYAIFLALRLVPVSWFEKLIQKDPGLAQVIHQLRPRT